jgi:hypothetical protein
MIRPAKQAQDKGRSTAATSGVNRLVSLKCQNCSVINANAQPPTPNSESEFDIRCSALSVRCFLILGLEMRCAARWWIGRSEGDAKNGGEAATLLATRSELAFHHRCFRQRPMSNSESDFGVRRSVLDVRCFPTLRFRPDRVMSFIV